MRCILDFGPEQIGPCLVSECNTTSPNQEIFKTCNGMICLFNGIVYNTGDNVTVRTQECMIPCSKLLYQDIDSGKL